MVIPTSRKTFTRWSEELSRATVRDVAQLAGVSVATVSRVLNGTKKVSDSATRQVHEAVAQLGFIPSPTAQNLRLSKTKTLGLVLPELENPFFPALIDQAVAVAEDSGYAITIRVNKHPLAVALQMSQGQHVDGILIVGSQEEEVASPNPAESMVPLVAFDRLPEANSISLFQVDNRGGANEVVSHVISRCPVATSILHIAGPSGLDVTKARQAGFKQAVQNAHRLGRHIGTIIFTGDFTETAGYQITQEWLDNTPLPGAIFAANDLMAIGALRAAHAQGMAIGKDILIAGFDGLTLGDYVTPTLTTYRQPIRHISQEAVSHLIRMIETDTGEEITSSRNLFKGTLVIRESTGGIGA